MKYLIFFLLYAHLLCAYADDLNNLYFNPNYIYGEENAPENIYYKYIRNNESNLFFYSLMECEDIYVENRILIIMMLIPLESSEGIFLIYNTNLNDMRQYTIIFEDNVNLSYGTFPLFVAKEELSIPSAELLYRFLLNQNNFNFTLSSKQDLLNLISSVLPHNVIAYIDRFSIEDPAYIRNNE